MMNEQGVLSVSTAWFVGAMYGGSSDQMPRFIEEGIWENGYESRYTAIVNTVKVGDKIVIKSAYTRKNGLPFDNKGRFVSVMVIKAIGTVIENYLDGHKLKVEWEVLKQPKEWYFFTGRNTIWRVSAEDGWMQKNLLDFTFMNEKQDVNKFISDPYWNERYGETILNQFEWTDFYVAIAKALLPYRDNRAELLDHIKVIFEKLSMKNPLMERDDEGREKLLNDICPFTVIGLFNKGITNENRRMIMEELADFLGVSESIPISFDGIPVLNNMRAWFFGGSNDRKEDDIDNLWNLYEIAMQYSENSNDYRQAFIDSYNKVIDQHGILWNITVGLYWIKPFDYLPLDQNTRTCLKTKLNIELKLHSTKRMCKGEDYLALIENLKSKFKEESYPAHSIPELSFQAWNGGITSENDSIQLKEEEELTDYKTYTKQDFLLDAFINEEKYSKIISRLEKKKNIILQGSPGVGKSYLAKKLAYSVLGYMDNEKVQMIQFHQSYSYKDFIMGYRPNNLGGFDIVEGVFYRFCKKAISNPTENYYFIIDEINRGNLSKIFGELMLLIEADKRGKEFAMSTVYEEEKLFIPENLYIIGLMNTADRSLALIDYALRRRFSFIDIEPAFGDNFNKYISKFTNSNLSQVINIMIDLNDEIKNDSSLGKGFCIGHSYFCNLLSGDYYELSEIIDCEIIPLLEEYWFDVEDKVKDWTNKLHEALIDG